MGIGLDQPAVWRGWEQTGTAARSVDSGARVLPGDGSPNRPSSNIRSWLALGSPLELLSPLAVLRVNFAFGTVAFTLVGCLGATTRAGVVTSAAVGICTLAIWVTLLLVRRIAPNPCRLLSAYWTSAVAVLIVIDRSGQTAAVLGFLLVPSAVFVSMFFARRVVLWQIGLASLALWLALSAAHGFAVGSVLAVVAVVAMASAPIAVLLVSRASRRSGLVDPETGLPNGLGLARATAASAEHPYLVVVVSLSGVGECREALGYPAAAELLRRAVEQLGQVVPAGARIGRVEGDEIVIVVDRGPSRPGPWNPFATSAQSDVRWQSTAFAGDLAGMVGAAIATGRYLVGDLEVAMRPHLGLAMSPDDGVRLADLIRRASLSARRATELGVPSCAWDGDRDAMTSDDLELLASLRRALGGRGLSLAYQLQFPSGRDSPVSAEALVRWDLDGDRVPPDRFIPLAERTGLVDRLTRWVLNEALDAQVRWRAIGVDLPVSVNISARNLADPGLFRWVLEALDSRSLPSTCLTVEITESAVTDLDQALAVLGPLRARGVRISMDDFGTGFTSLSALPRLPLDELKIDQGFVRRSPGSPADDAIVATTCDLGHRLGLVVVAEGVEDAAIQSRLVSHGVDLLQGYHLARPLAEAQLLERLGAGAPSPSR
jgi:EAL domain-containing protein (putative c-di-GMP-specific phosphodiesterase class I)/GGDEF domain-containing protein